MKRAARKICGATDLRLAVVLVVRLTCTLFEEEPSSSGHGDREEEEEEEGGWEGTVHSRNT